MSKISQAFVLAAGLGKRIRSHAPDLPKPLVSVAGRSLLDRVLDQLAAANIHDVIINVHYLADKIEAHLQDRNDVSIRFSDERGELLETGGGLKKALPLMKPEPILAINSDALWLDHWQETSLEPALTHMMRTFDANKMDVYLLMVPLDHARYFEGKGDFLRDDEGRLTRRPTDYPDDPSAAGLPLPYIYGGIQIIQPHILKEVEQNRFSLNTIYDNALKKGRLYGHVFGGTWMHIGNPEAVKDAEEYFEKAAQK